MKKISAKLYRPHDVLVEEAKVYIFDNLNDTITIEEICTHLDISKAHFIRSFKEVMDITPYAFIMNVKVSKAKEMLSRGEEITYVALRAGFYDQSHLNRVFKKNVRITPYEYRKLFVS